MTRTAVVILNYNGESFLKKFLPLVILHSGEAEIYLADNGSTDSSIVLVTTDFPKVKIINLGVNYGFCEGYNRALRQIKAHYYILLNSDVEVTPGWLLPMTALLDSDHTIAAVQPKILSFNERNKFEYAGAAGGFVDVMGYPFCRGRVFNQVEEDNGQYDDVRQVFWATGACLMIRSSIFHTFNGFDKDLFAHMEEIDLCWKINRTNYKVFYCGKSTVYHVGAGTLSYENPKKTFLNFRNGLILIFKHFSKKELIWKLPLRLLLDWLAAIVFFFRGQGKNGRAVFSAHAEFLKHRKIHYKKRRELQRQFPWYSRKNVYQQMILADFYLKGRKVIGI